VALLYLDEGLSAQTDRRLVTHGNDVVYARSVVRDGTSDHLHLLIATQLGRILVTHNRTDFELLHFAWQDWFASLGPTPRPMHGGIVIVPQPPLVDAHDAADLVHTFVNDPMRAQLANRLFVWGIASGWTEQLPQSPLPPRPNTARRSPPEQSQ
jgi:hypothetical protein